MTNDMSPWVGDDYPGHELREKMRQSMFGWNWLLKYFNYLIEKSIGAPFKPGPPPREWRQKDANSN